MGRRPFPAFVLILYLALSVSAQGEDIPWNPAPGRYASARVSVALSSGASAEYRFVENGDGIWRPWTGALDLSAFPREERVYRIQLKIRRGTERTEMEARYVIDRLPPAAPSVSPASGSYEGPVDLRLSAETGAAIFYSLEAQDRPSPGFRAYDSSELLRIDRPKDGTRAWTLSAYAVDSSGNPGPVMTALYSVEPDPSGADTRENTASVKSPLSEGAAIEYSMESQTPGMARLVFAAGNAKRVFAAVNPSDPRDASYYTELPVVSGKAHMELSAPPGWTGPLVVRCAILEEGALSLSPEPMEISFSYEDPTEPPPSPPEPDVVSPPGTRTALLSWEPFPFRIEVSVGGGNFSPYTTPISVVVPDGGEGLVVRYRSIGPGGAASAIRSLTLTPARQTGLPDISGLPDGGVTNQSVRPRAPLGAVIRFEVSGEGLPPPVTGSSPLLDENAVFSGEEGKDTRYTLRIRAFSDASESAAGSDERFLSFVVDRLPPPAPKLSAGSLDVEAEEDRVVAFEPGEGSVQFAVVEKGSPEEPIFKAYEGAILLAGSGDRPVAYEVYAYAVDAAGNKSETVGPVSVRIDRASVYVASWGNDSAAGGPRNPLASLSAGVDAAVRAGKRFVRLQGDVPLGDSLRPAGPVEILGGCDESWEPVPGSRSLIDVPDREGPFFHVYGTELVLRNLSIVVKRSRDLTLAEVGEGTLEASNLELDLSASGELFVVRARDSRILLSDSTVSLTDALFARVVDARGGETQIRGLRIRAEKTVGYFTAFSFQDGAAVVTGLRSESMTTGGFTLLRGVRTQAYIRDSYIKAQGFGYCEVFRFEGGQAAIYLTSADLSCEGPLSFASLEGAKGDILHSTVSLSSKRSVFLDLKDSPVRLGNSILSDRTGEGVMIRTNIAPRRGAFVRNALSGFRTYIEGSADAATVEALNQIAAPPDGMNFTDTFGWSDRKGYVGLPILSSSSSGRSGAYPLTIPSPSGALTDTAVRRDVGAFEVLP